MAKQKAGDPERQAKLRKAYESLKKVRASKTVTLKPSRFMRDKFEALDGTEQDLKLRYYQVQGVYHLMLLKRMVLGDDTGLGKTIEAIATMCHLFERDPTLKVVIVTPKSTVHQWASEIRKFTTGIRPLVAESPKSKSKDGATPLDMRKAIYREWADAPTGPDAERVVLIINYAILVRDWNAEGFRPVKENGKPDPKQPVVPGVLDQETRGVSASLKLVVFEDECQAFKNMRTKTWEVVRQLNDRADRAYGLTATLLDSHLMEGYCIYKAIKPELFGSKTAFLKSYCLTELKDIPGKRQKIPIVIGYKNLDHYRDRIDPFFLGRFKHDVSDELPTIISKDVVCELSEAENKKYSEALSGIIELGDGDVRDYEENRALVALIYCQQVVDSLTLLKFDAEDVIGEAFDIETFESKDIKVGVLGAKEQALTDLLEGELEGEKVIVYTRFASLVPRLQKVLDRIKVKSVFISGKATDSKRKEAQTLFQDKDSDVKVIFITDAGGVGINLQMARALIFYDLPWTWGKYVQCLDMATEVLTPRGWLTHGDLSKDDLVAAMDPLTSQIEWKPIQAIYHRPLGLEERMYSLSNAQLDIRVTGDHRMLFKRKTLKDKKPYWPKEWRFETAVEMADERTEFRVPVSGVESSDGLALSDSELQFIGWFLTDGTYNPCNKQIQVYQATHQPQIENLRRCLADCGFDWKEYERDPSKISGTFPNGKTQIVFTIPKGTGKGSRKRNGWAPLGEYLDKNLSPELEKLTQRQLSVLLEGIHLGDGSKQPKNVNWSQKSYHISTGNRVFADRLQSLCIRRGFKCNISPTKKGLLLLHIKFKGFAALSGYTGDSRPRLSPSPSKPGEFVWCVENEVGTLVTRRNGKTAILGNCLGRMVRIGSPHKGVIAYHLMAERPFDQGSRKTIDHHVLSLLRKKKRLIDKVLGEGIKDALEFEKDGTSILDLIQVMRKEAEGNG